MEIKKSAQQGNKEACRILAKQLIEIRKQKTRTYAMNSKVFCSTDFFKTYVYFNSAFKPSYSIAIIS